MFSISFLKYSLKRVSHFSISVATLGVTAMYGYWVWLNKCIDEMAVKMKIGEGGVEEIKYLLKREKKGKREGKEKGGV